MRPLAVLLLLVEGLALGCSSNAAGTSSPNLVVSFDDGVEVAVFDDTNRLTSAVTRIVDVSEVVTSAPGAKVQVEGHVVSLIWLLAPCNRTPEVVVADSGSGAVAVTVYRGPITPGVKICDESAGNYGLDLTFRSTISDASVAILDGVRH